MPDYFEFMGLPRSIAIDADELQQRYYRLSREHHPDFHTNASDADRAASLENASTLNQAYRTLRDPFERARYLLGLEWPDQPDASRRQIPPSLLMEVMEMQEAIAEAQFETDAARRAERTATLLEVEKRLHARTDALRAELDAIGAEWSAAGTLDGASRTALLERLNQLLNTRNYLRTLLATIDSTVRGGEAVRH